MLDLFLLCLYCFAFLGNISFSYFMLRVLHPDARELSISSKLRFSFAISIFTFFLAAISASMFGIAFLFATFPAIIFLVHIFDEVMHLPKRTVKRKIAVPIFRKK